MQNTKTRWALVAILAFAFASAPLGAQAQRRSSARGPFYAGVGLGPAGLFFHEYTNCCDLAFRVEGEFGWHADGTDTGFFLAGVLAANFDGYWWTFHPAFKLGGDIEIYNGGDVALLLTPAGALGFGVWDLDGPWGSLGYFVLQPSLGLQILLADRLVRLWFRPIAFDILMFPDWYFDNFEADVIYSFMAGVHFAF